MPVPPYNSLASLVSLVAPLSREVLRREEVSKPTGRRWTGANADVLDQCLFTDVLTREWKKAYRFQTAFVLLSIKVENQGSSEQWTDAVDAIRTVKRDTDLIGWQDSGRTLALLRLDVDLQCETGEVVAAAARTALAKLAGANKGRVSIQAREFSPTADVPPLDASSQGAPHREATKRALDVIASAAALAVGAPVLLAVAALVKCTSKGPVLFRQERVGRHAKPFTMLKFRTMNTGVDDAIHRQFVERLIETGSGAEAPEAAEGKYKIVNDPRVTPVGRLLRRTSLDELPQFWNVLKGDMSLVGPRPPLSYEVERYKPWHRRRVLEAKPGVTGLWQVEGRSRTTFDDMVRMDLRYAKGHSLWTDIKILIATPKAMLTGKGAH